MASRHRSLLLFPILCLLLAACGGTNNVVTSTAVGSAVVVGQTSLPKPAGAAPSAAPLPTTAVPSPTLVPLLPATQQPTARQPVPTATQQPVITQLAPPATPQPSAQPAAVSAPTASAPTLPPSATQVPIQPVAGGTTPAGAAIRPHLAGKLVFRRDNDLFLYRPRTGEVKLIVPGGEVPRWSPDGSQLAWIKGGALYLGGAAGEQPRALFQLASIDTIRWSPDGSRLVVHRMLNEGRSGEIYEWDLPAGPLRKIGDGNDPAWAPDSKRIAYVTIPSDSGIRRTQLRLVNWQGQNGWAPVRDVPRNAPPIGIPNSQRQPAEFEHVLSTPVWDAAGASAYVIAQIGMQVETDFGMWERADMHNGGSSFVDQLVNVFAAVGAPNRQAAVLVHSTARGDTFFTARSLGNGEAPAWINTDPGFRDDAPAWSPDSVALAYYHCPLDSGNTCDLVVRRAGGSATLISGIVAAPRSAAIPAPFLDWAIDR